MFWFWDDQHVVTKLRIDPSSLHRHTFRCFTSPEQIESIQIPHVPDLIRSHTIVGQRQWDTSASDLQQRNIHRRKLKQNSVTTSNTCSCECGSFRLINRLFIFCKSGYTSEAFWFNLVKFSWYHNRDVWMWIFESFPIHRERKKQKGQKKWLRLWVNLFYESSFENT